MKGIVLLTLSALMLGAPLARADHDIPGPSTQIKAFLGAGYASDKEKFVGRCVAPDPKEGEYAGDQVAHVYFDQSLSQEELSSELGFSVGGRARFGLTSVSAQAKFLTASTSTSFSIASTYHAEYAFKSWRLEGNKLTDVGNRVKDSNDRWKTTCGDEYVDQIDLGAKLFFSIRLDFSSESEKESFEAGFNISGPLWGAEGTLKQASQRFNKNVHVVITALQIGGDITELTKLFNFDGQPDGRMGFVQCTLGTLDKCTGVLSSAIAYATDTNSGFPKQIKSNDTTSLAGPAFLTYHTKGYEALGYYKINPPELTAEIVHARKRLSDLYEDMALKRLTAERLLGEGNVVRLSTRQRGVMQKQLDQINANIHYLVQASVACFEHPEGCPAAESAAESNQAVLPLDLFHIVPESFAQFCDLAQLPNPDLELRKTVSSMVTEACKFRRDLFPQGQYCRNNEPRPVNPQPAIDVCSETERVLADVRELDLHGQGLSDLRPLAPYTGLERLDLSDNNLSDISALATFAGLRYLNLSDNQVGDASALAKLPLLDTLILTNNRIDVKCPLGDASRCRMGYFKGSSFVLLSQGPATRRARHTATVLDDGRVLLAGGNKASKTAELFDGAHFRATLKPMLASRSCHTASRLPDGRVLLAGGWGGGNTTELFDPAREEFTSGGPLTTARACQTATVVGEPGAAHPRGLVLLTGGQLAASGPNEGDYLATAELYDAGTDRSVEVAGFGLPRSGHTATLLRDGRVLLAGGSAASGVQGLSQLFEPILRQFHVTGRLIEARSGHSATLLSDGRVLVAGGFSDDGSAMTSAEIYDPDTGRWHAARTPLNEPRGGHTATLLSNGKVLITGGQSRWLFEETDVRNCQTCVKSAEIFDPVSESFTAIPHPLNGPRTLHTATVLNDSLVLLLGGIGDYASGTAELFEYGQFAFKPR